MGDNIVFDKLVSLLGTAEDNNLQEGRIVPYSHQQENGRYDMRTLNIKSKIDPKYSTEIHIEATSRGVGNDIDYRYVDICFYTLDDVESQTISSSRIRIDSVVPLEALWSEDSDYDAPPNYSRYEPSDYSPNGYYYMGNFTQIARREKVEELVQDGIMAYLSKKFEGVVGRPPLKTAIDFNFVVELMERNSSQHYSENPAKWRGFGLPKESMLWTPQMIEGHREDSEAILATTNLMWDFISMICPSEEDDYLHEKALAEIKGDGWDISSHQSRMCAFREAWNTVWIPGLEMDVKWAKDEARESLKTLREAEKAYEAFAEARKVLALIRKFGSIDGLYKGTREEIGRRIEEDLGVVNVDKRGWIQNPSVTFANHIEIPPGYPVGNHLTKAGHFSKAGLMSIHEMIDASASILEEKEEAFAKSVNTLRTACKMAEISFEKEVLSILGMHGVIGELGEFYCNFWVREGHGKMEGNAFTEKWLSGDSYNFNNIGSNDYRFVPIKDAGWRDDNARLTTEDSEPHLNDPIWIDGSLGDVVRGLATYTDEETREQVKIRISGAYVSRAKRNYSGTETTMVKARAIVKDLARFNVEYAERHSRDDGKDLADAVVATIYEVFPQMKKAVWHDGGSVVWPPAYSKEEVIA